MASLWEKVPEEAATLWSRAGGYNAPSLRVLPQ